MNRNYEGLIVLDVQGKEENVDQIIGAIGSEMESSGARLEQIDQIGKRKFPYPKKLDEGFYVNFIFQAEPGVIEIIQEKLEHNSSVHQQHFQRRR